MSQWLVPWALVVAFAAWRADSSDPTKYPLVPDSQPDGSNGQGSRCWNVSDDSAECSMRVCTDTFPELGLICTLKCHVSTDCPLGEFQDLCNASGYCRPPVHG